MTVREAPVDMGEGSRRITLPVAERVRERVHGERDRLMREAGLFLPVDHFRRPTEHRFTRSQRDTTTILFGGLTLRHEELILAALEGVGYRVARLPIPSKADFQAGKEYGNNGQCNPTYFTVGNLVNYLKRLRDGEGMPTERILKDYVFMTAGSCGPCRFGMYEAEYRLALRNAGFDGFRVLLFDQTGGANQAAEGAGIEFNLAFFLAILNAMLIGDLLNEIAFHIRPYEVEAGNTDRAMARCMQICGEALRNKGYGQIHGGRISRSLAGRLPLSGPDDLALMLDQLFGRHFHDALRACMDVLNEQVEVDYTRPRPVVKVTGEFWAQTTEGDGNFRMFSFLEGEGAQVLVEPVATWIGYIFHTVTRAYRDRRGLKEGEAPAGRWDLPGRLRQGWRYRKTLVLLDLIGRILNREYDRLRQALGGTAHALANQLELQRLGNPYYNARAQGGEGHMEVAKNIYYASRELAHMVLSLKPFGCMPSTQSDGAQAAVVSHYPDMIYLPIETSGEGDINAYSRVQMALGEAKVKCKAEFAQAVQRTGYSLQRIQAYIADHRELRRPIQPIGHHKGVIGQAANFILGIAERMKAEGIATGA